MWRSLRRRRRRRRRRRTESRLPSHLAPSGRVAASIKIILGLPASRIKSPSTRRGRQVMEKREVQLGLACGHTGHSSYRASLPRPHYLRAKSAIFAPASPRAAPRWSAPPRTCLVSSVVLRQALLLYSPPLTA